MYGIVIAQCGVQRLEQKYRRPFARTNAFGPGVKGSGATRGRLDGKGRIGLYRQINNMAPLRLAAPVAGFTVGTGGVSTSCQ